MSRARIGLAFLLAAAVAASSGPAGESPAAAQKQKKGGPKGPQQGGPKHVFAGPPPDHPVDVILGRPTDRSVTVSVLAYQDTTARIAYGPGPGRPVATTAERVLRKGEPAEFVLAGLTPDTRYSYRLETREAGGAAFRPGDEWSFHTRRRPGSPLVFTLQADSHLDQGTRPAVYERTLANALANGPTSTSTWATRS